MPLLDPDQQYFFCSRAKKIIPKGSRRSFFLKYLPIASNNLQQSYETIRISSSFQEFFLESIPELNGEFELGIPGQQKIEEQNIYDFYRYFYDQFEYQEENIEGTYCKVESMNNLYSTKSKLKFFETSLGSLSHKWQFMDYSVVILSIYGTSPKKFSEQEIKFLKLEITILKSVGFTLVLCLHLDSSSEPEIPFNLIKTGFFSEIHVNLDPKFNDRKSNDIQIYRKFITKISEIFKFESNKTDLTFYGYFYLYSTYSDEIKEISKKMKEIKTNPYFNRFFYSKQLDKIFIIYERGKNFDENSDEKCKLLYHKSNPFVYCDVGFKCQMIKVHLNKIPLYDDQFDVNSYSPKEITQLTWGYVKNTDFTTWPGSRVEILFNDNTSSYVDFDDLHIMKPEFFVSDTLHFMKATQSSIDELDRIKNKAISLIIEYTTFQMKNFSGFTKTTIVDKGLANLYYSIFKLQNKELRRNQLFAALEASLSCLFNDDSKEKGIVYQLDTGEGKSLIIQMIAALLASTGKMVHIATSNIHLANRDYSQSCEFFKNLGINSSVLLHSNEIPRPDNNEKEDLEINYEIFKNDPFFSDAKFENSLDMNFEVCGLGNHGEELSKGCKIVFSTFINFEALYLKMTENWSPRRINEYFKNQYLIIDEADTILIDELVNGTILSHSLPSNASDVLTFIYQCKTGRLTPENVNKIIDHFYPKFDNKNELQEKYLQLLSKRREELEEEINNEMLQNALSKTFLSVSSKKVVFKKEDNKEDEKSDENLENIVNFIYNITRGQLSKKYIKVIFAELFDESSGIKMTDSELNKIDLIYDNVEKELKPQFQEQHSNNEKSTTTDNTKSEITPFDEEKAKDLFLFIYQILRRNPSPTKIIDLVKESWPQSGDLNKLQIEQMYKEIELVHTPEFQNGTRYVIRPVNQNKKKENKKVKKIKKVVEYVTQAFNIDQVISDKIEKQMDKKMKEKLENLKNDVENGKINVEEVVKKDEKNQKTKKQEEDQEEEIDESKILEVFPYDYDNKGILEQNKEFSGFIQQFIAIKEKMNDPVTYKHLTIKGLTFNYLYVSHPIFTELYKKVCGFTGTIGNHYDKEIFKKHYKLSTFKIPRDKVNRRVNLPMILCKDIDDRNKKIKDEVIRFNEQRKPVLVVLRDINEVQELKELFESYLMKDINVFDGTKISLSPEEIAGRDGSISIGTNFCGRGTDIKNTGQPLHVIVAYYSSNIRTIQQAFGRTARKGSEGTCRIICQVSEYTTSSERYQNENVNNVVNKFEFKKKAQSDFIEQYRKKFEWLFSNRFEKKIKIGRNKSYELKKTRINVNRIVACNYKFPVGMSIDTFLSIQAQKIFSLYNCPNCIYTWMLFQRYVREFLLESWSMMIENVDLKYNNYLKKNKSSNLTTNKSSNLTTNKSSDLTTNKSSDLTTNESLDLDNSKYIRLLNKNIKKLKESIDKYFPQDNKNDILSTFMSFHISVKNEWKPIMDTIFDNNCFKLKGSIMSKSFLSINFGFIPYALIDNSGSRISSFNKESENSYIKDPELTYYKQIDGKSKILCSITQKIDDLFDMICNIINQKLGAFTGLRLFLRRTIAGCEFGVCLDFHPDNLDYSKIGSNCLFDKEPTMLFSIHVKSFVPILAGILVVVLVYAAKIAMYLAEGGALYIGKKIAQFSLSTIVKFLASNGLEIAIEKLFNVMISFLLPKLRYQINYLKNIHKGSAALLEAIASVFFRNEFSGVSSGISDKFGKSFKANSKVTNIFEKLFPYVLRISIILILCLVAFIMNFKHKMSIEKFDLNAKSKAYQGENAKNAFNDNEKIVETINPSDKELK